MPKKDGKKDDIAAGGNSTTDGRRMSKKRKLMESNSNCPDEQGKQPLFDKRKPPSETQSLDEDSISSTLQKTSTSKKKKGRKVKLNKGDADEEVLRHQCSNEIATGDAKLSTTTDGTTKTDLWDQAKNKSKKKKDKKKKRDPDHVHQSSGQNKALRYLDIWDESRSTDRVTWKFEKCRQIWLLQNAYDESKVPDKAFDVLLKYMCTIKGRMRDAAIDTAKSKLSKAEETEANKRKLKEEGKTEAEILLQSEASELVDEKILQRAADIVEMLL